MANTYLIMEKDTALRKVIKIFRISGKSKVLAKNLTLEQAQRMVQSYPDSTRSMVIYNKQ